MKKILFYGNDIEDFKRFVVLAEKLQKEGMEVAFASDIDNLRRFIITQKGLVVNPTVYKYDAYVAKKKYLGEPKYISLEDIEGLV